jgi:Carboxypeptidase regulatory-like domain
MPSARNALILTLAVSLSLFGIPLSMPTAQGQDPGIGGSAMAPNGQPHGGQPITVTDGAGNQVAATTTAADGSFQLPPVPEGDYTVGIGKASYPMHLAPGMSGLDVVAPASVIAGEEEGNWKEILLIGGVILLVAALSSGGFAVWAYNRNNPRRHAFSPYNL